QKTHELLKNSKSINYNGFIEANNITDTENHIIVTDGINKYFETKGDKGNFSRKISQELEIILDKLKSSTSVPK
ncbi:hypothetical protein N9S78_00730, partial [bacterium]|nr:hypothetical protein [bacterium]